MVALADVRGQLLQDSLNDDDDDDAAPLQGSTRQRRIIKPAFNLKSLYRVCARRVVLSSILVSIFVVIVLLKVSGKDNNDNVAVANGMSPNPGAHWSSFRKISQIYAFGDSWTSTGFFCSRTWPSPTNPFGHVELPGYTSSNGLNWLDYVTYVYNHSTTMVYNYAMGGATVDAAIIRAYMVPIDFVYEAHLAIDGGKAFAGDGTTDIKECKSILGTWDPTNALVVVWFGVNDVSACHGQCDPSQPPLDSLFQSYTRSLERLFTEGARNFLLINSPPSDVWSMPGYPSLSEGAKARMEMTIGFNQRHRQLVRYFRETYTDSTIFEYDVYGLFQRIFENPQSRPETRIYRNLTGLCEAYEEFEHQRKPNETELEQCGGLKPEEYLWLNGNHVSWPMHHAIAKEIMALLTMYD